MPILKVVNPKNYGGDQLALGVWRASGPLFEMAAPAERKANNDVATRLRAASLSKDHCARYYQKTHLTQRAAHHASNSAAA
ncbi:hypothetical protein ACA085_00430 [Xanthomonas fragariae]|uniref:hypothetical protein n=1 Tax=Xanthomonas fragariae TaxID=48664 RepID=UPI00353130CE